ncbi:MAG: DUF2344 domain-containing protein [Planctomycetes bacterium]|nr:DUF2344 domain-containing protein [Planctomycetota bacterium]
MRFLSHRETVRFWQRILTRTEAPVRFSEGFNPHMRLSLPLPRNVGVSGAAELLLLEVAESYPTEQLAEALVKHLPDGIKLKGIKEVPRRTRSFPEWAQYQMGLSEAVDRTELDQRIQQFMAEANWPITRVRRSRHPQRTIDLRQGVRELQLSAEGMYCTIEIRPEGAIRIEELLTALKINSPKLVLEIKRTTIGYPSELLMD